jgi:hydrogenase expression/formation protein HypC
MCLAVPARVTLVHDGRMAEVDIQGVVRKVSLDLVPDADVDSWVLVHAGFAIQVVDEQFAAESWDLIKQMMEADAALEAELGLAAAPGAAGSEGDGAAKEPAASPPSDR